MGKNETADSDASKQTKNQAKVEIPQLYELQRLISEPGLWPSELCIYKVPRKLRALNPAAYTPQMISIGPFHLNDDGLKVMQKQKLKYLVGFCTRTAKKDSVDLIDKIREWEERIRHCYEVSTTDEISKEDFANMILLDSVFIIELFLRRGEKYKFFENGNNHEYKDDYILGKSTREYGLLEDIILVENQLPYFVLEDLYDLTIGKLRGYPPFFDLMVKNFKDYLSPPEIGEQHKKCSCDCFSCFYCFWIPRCFSCSKLNDQSVKGEEEEEKGEDGYLEEKPLNFTDLIRKYRCYKRPKSNNNDGKTVKNLYRATRLREAGVKFKVSPKSWPINMKFKRGELRMPLFIVDDNTERLIRNLMAFEQCHYPNDPFICDYIWILDFLIYTEQDVDLLCRKVIIVNLLGDNESVAKLVGNLGLQIRASGSCFYDMSVRLNEHYDNPWYRTVAVLRRVYFEDLWRSTGTVVAMLLLVFTITQSVSTIRDMF